MEQSFIESRTPAGPPPRQEVTQQLAPEQLRSEYLDIDHLLSAAKRQAGLVVLSVMLFVGIAVVYLMFATPKYTATGAIVVSLEDGAQQAGDTPAPRPISTAAQEDGRMLDQMEVILSKEIGTAVVKRLDLKTIDGVPANPETIWENVIAPNLSVVRRGISHVLEINYTSADAGEAARVLEAYLDVYQQNQTTVAIESAERASKWLEGRLQDLQVSSLKAARAVEDYRAENGLLTTEGSRLSEQQLSLVSARLAQVRLDRSSAEARLATLQDLISSGNPANLADLAGDTTSGSDTSRRHAELLSQLGQNHGTLERLSREVEGRLVAETENNISLLKAEENSLLKQMNTLTAEVNDANVTSVELSQLERNAQALETLYNSSQLRYQETIQRQSFPYAGGQIISAPSVPTEPSSPNKIMVIVAGIFLGGMVGSGLGAIREYRERTFRNPRQIPEVLGLNALGIAPLLRSEKRTWPLRRRGRTAPPVPNGIWRHVVDQPQTQFSQTVHNAAVTAIMRTKPRTPVIGVISTLTGEGKSVMSSNLAQLMAFPGSRALLIDADIRNPAVTEAYGLKDQPGILQVLGGGEEHTGLHTFQEGRLSVLPVGECAGSAQSLGILGTSKFGSMVLGFRKEFDTVVIDLPPTNVSPDLRLLAEYVDVFLLIVEWGSTSRELVRQMLIAEPQIAQKCFGVILNKVNLAKARKYDVVGRPDYHVFGRPKQ